MSQRIPINDVKAIAQRRQCPQVILVAWDGAKTHVVTYGRSEEECAQAAEGGNRVKRALNWPESMCNAEPKRMSVLRDRIHQLVTANQALEDNAVKYRGMIRDLEDKLSRPRREFNDD